jgi:MYXO-CTERM domain-containing protein
VRNAFLPAGVAAVALAVASPARANGRFPAANELLFSPTNDDLVILRTTFGILPSQDSGATWSWLCEDALGLSPSSNEDPNLALTSSGSLIAGLSLGLLVSPDTGCNWTPQGGAFQGQRVADLDVAAQAPDTVFAITSTYQPDAGADGGAGYIQHVFTSMDDGADWSMAGTIDPAAIVTTLAVAPTDPQRIYVSAYRGDGLARTTSIFASSNGGQTWTEQPTPFDSSTETAVYIAAVDPQDEDVVYVRSALPPAPAGMLPAGASRLFVTRDGARTSFQVAFSLEQDSMLGFALSPDGSKVYLGGPSDGLYVASSADLEFTHVLQRQPDGGTTTIHVQCLATHGADLWACSDEVSGFLAGVSQDDGVTFTPKLHLLGIQGALSCPPGSTASKCSETDFEAAVPYDPLASLCFNLGACVDAGPPPALTATCRQSGACGATTGDGGSAADGGTPGPKSSSGCSVGGSGAAGALAGVGLALLAARRKRRR